jgi:hypothetical protein
MRQLFLGGGWLTQDDPVDETDPLGGQGSLEGLGKLVMWCKNELYGMKDKTTGEWVREVAKRNAEMVGMWQVYGYCHGVLNTDKWVRECSLSHGEVGVAADPRAASAYSV